MRVPYFGRHAFLYAKNTARRRPARVCAPPTRECPELGREAFVFECLECEKYSVWHEKDGFRRCYYEFRELESRGFYDGTWDDHPENFDPETFARIQERKRRNEEINRELETEWEALERKAKELGENGEGVHGDMIFENGEDHGDEDADDEYSEDGESQDQPTDGKDQEEDYFWR